MLISVQGTRHKSHVVVRSMNNAVIKQQAQLENCIFQGVGEGKRPGLSQIKTCRIHGISYACI